MNRQLQHIAIISAALCLLASCKVGKRYARPELNLPDRIEATTEGDSSSVADIPWESLYEDETLRQLIHKALENNKDVNIAAARLKEMMAARRISFADLFPDVKANVYFGKEQLNYGGNNYFASVENVRALQMTIVAEVATNYYQLRALDRELSIVQQTLTARREGVRLAKLRYEGGLTPETAYNQAQVEMARTETLVPDLERQIEIKESDLSMLLGEYSGEIPRGADLGDQHLPETLPVGLPSTLLERRPDMRQAELTLQAANARVGIAKANMFPRITLTGDLGFESNEVSTLLKSGAWNVIGGLTQPLVGLAKNRANLKAAQARYEQEVLQYQKSVLGAFKEVNNAIVTVRKVKEVRASMEKLESSARNYLELAQLQYINGVTSYMDVLDAQRGLLDAQIGLNDAVLNELLSIVSLYKALGGGYGESDTANAGQS